MLECGALWCCLELHASAYGSVEFGNVAEFVDLAACGICPRRRAAHQSCPAWAVATVNGAEPCAHAVRGLVSSVRRRSCVLATAPPAVDGATARLRGTGRVSRGRRPQSRLVLRIIAEPAERAALANDVTMAVLGASALLQVAAALVFVIQLWPRVGPRPIRGKGENLV